MQKVIRRLTQFDIPYYDINPRYKPQRISKIEKIHPNTKCFRT